MAIERRSRKRPWLVRSRAWISILIVASFAVIELLSVPVVKEETVADLLLDTAGWLSFFFGATFRWWATLYVGGRKDKELAVDGPYSVCRNPLYFGTFLLTLSIAFFVHSLMFAIGLLIATPLYLTVTVPWEENRLLKEFGERYEEYRQRVPKFLPNFSKVHSPPMLQVNLAGITAEYRRALRWMWVPMLAEAAAHLRMETWWPIVIRWP